MDQPAQKTIAGEIERILGAYASQLELAKETALLDVIAQSRASVEWLGKDWNETQIGVYLLVPAPVYNRIRGADLEQLRDKVRTELNAISGYIRDEYISDVNFYPEPEADPDWRSRYLGTATVSVGRPVPKIEQIDELWGACQLKAFISHRPSAKQQAHLFKTSLANWDISGFVAHDDIKPLREWQIELERALDSMELMIVLLTSDFHEGEWTDQEIGFAVGRGITIVPINAGVTPYGFIAKYQDIKVDFKSLGESTGKLMALLLNQPHLHNRIAKCCIHKFERARSFAEANSLMDLIEQIERFSDEDLEKLRAAVRENDQVSGAFEVQGRLPKVFSRHGVDQ